MSEKPKKKDGPSKGLHTVFSIPLALLSGCLVFLSFPSFNLFPLQWFSLVPLIIACRGRRGLYCLFLGFLAGLATNLGGFYWISHVLQEFGHMQKAWAWALTVLVACYQALPFAISTSLAGALAFRFQKDFLWFLSYPFLFTAFEYLVPFIFPWYFANGQQPFYAATQIVEWTGVSGLTFLLVLVNVAIASLLWSFIGHTSFPIFQVLFAALAFGANIVYGVLRIEEVDSMVAKGPHFRAALVEADVGVWEKEAKDPMGRPLPIGEQIRVLYRNLLKHQILSQKAEAEYSPDLIVWSESSYMPLTDVYWRKKEREVAVLGGNSVFWASRWSSEAPEEAKNLSGLRGIGAAHEDYIIAVGRRGAAFVYDGERWAREQTGTDRDLNAVAISPDGKRAVAVGAQGVIVVRSEDAWSLVPSSVTSDLRAVAYVSSDRFIACGDSGALVEIRGLRAKPLDSGTTEDLIAVAASEEKGLFVGGRNGVLLREVHGHFERMAIPTGGSITALAVGEVLYAAPQDGHVLLTCEQKCEEVKRGLIQGRVLGLASDGKRSVFVLSEDGSVVFVDEDGEGKEVLKKGVLHNPKALAFIPMRKGYPLPRGLKALYVSQHPIQATDLEAIEKALEGDSNTPPRDRNAPMRGFSTPLLLGVITQDEDGRYYNSAILLDRDGHVLGQYDKNYLLIFGEYLPFSDIFPFLKNWFPEAGNFVPGKAVEVFELKGVRIGVMICYEDIIPAFSRRLFQKAPHLLVNITNDAWFGKTTEPYQHLGLATFRAIETRRFLLRTTNTGISAVIDPVGRIVKGTHLEDPEILIADVTLMSSETPYQRYGDLFAWGSCGISLLFLLVLVLARKGSRPSRPSK